MKTDRRLVTDAEAAKLRERCHGFVDHNPDRETGEDGRHVHAMGSPEVGRLLDTREELIAALEPLYWFYVMIDSGGSDGSDLETAVWQDASDAAEKADAVLAQVRGE